MLLFLISCSPTVQQNSCKLPENNLAVYEAYYKAKESLEKSQRSITTMVGTLLQLQAELYYINNNHCPNKDELFKNLPREDGWGNDFVIDCVPDPVIISSGPDSILGTKDDIVIQK
jgi:hypothetical protein